ncbi:hypothetical protein ACCO45_004286 [Purpureocillium lilacinum]|uniref:Uncharacterized protein n=1 Tax=Purpureocillium lilacinum TaxID=33203 RepID=A0ACC4E3E9_PURLI
MNLRDRTFLVASQTFPQVLALTLRCFDLRRPSLRLCLSLLQQQLSPSLASTALVAIYGIKHTQQ